MVGFGASGRLLAQKIFQINAPVRRPNSTLYSRRDASFVEIDPKRYRRCLIGYHSFDGNKIGLVTWYLRL
jgi:hypothetical protein